MSYNIFKQYYRACLVKLHLFNKGAYLIGLDKIYDDDVFISSYPKSGNTWLRMIIANMLNPDKEIHLYNIDKYIHGLYSARDIINSKKQNRIIKSHYPYFNYYPKTIYIYRDYRDVLVSYYHYQTALKKFTGSFSDFIRDENQLNYPYGSWVNHINEALKYAKKHPDKILILKYENLHTDTANYIKQISSFLSLTPPDNIKIEEIIKKTSFSTLKKYEETYGSDFKTESNTYFFREGTTNNWKDYFNETDLNWLLDHTEIKESLLLLGY